MADSLPLLLALELLDYSEVETSDVLGEDDYITLFSLNRVRDYFEGTIPLYFPDEFKGHFRTCELFRRAVMPTGRIALAMANCHPFFPLEYG